MMLHGRRGFTLVETMIAGSLLVSLSLLAMMWISGTTDLWWTTTTQGQVREEVLLAVRRMAADLRRGTRAAAGSPPNLVVPPAPGNTQMDFYVPADLDGNGTIIDALGNIEWDLTAPAANVTRVTLRFDAPTGQLQRVQNGQTTVLAADVSAAAFADAAIDAGLRPNEVRITLTVQRATPSGRVLTATSSEIVRLRN